MSPMRRFSDAGDHQVRRRFVGVAWRGRRTLFRPGPLFHTLMKFVATISLILVRRNTKIGKSCRRH